MVSGEDRDKDRMKRLERLERRISTHMRLAREAVSVAAHVDNAGQVIGAQHEMIGILVGVIKDQNHELQRFRNLFTARETEEDPTDGHAASAS